MGIVPRVVEVGEVVEAEADAHVGEFGVLVCVAKSAEEPLSVQHEDPGVGNLVGKFVLDVVEREAELAKRSGETTIIS